MTEPSSLRSSPPGGSNTLPPEPTRPEARRAIEAATSRLREELGATNDAHLRARLLVEIADMEERVRDEQGAARDYLEALGADSEQRESAEALARLFERRRSLKHMARAVDALVAAAMNGDDLVRALTMRAFSIADASGDVANALAAVREAAEAEASEQELGTPRFLVELFAAKGGDKRARLEALAARARAPGDNAWRALLLVDAARLAAEDDSMEEALALLDEARDLGGPVRYAVARRIEAVARMVVEKSDGERRAKAEAALAASVEAAARLVSGALDDAAVGDEAGVPRYVRTPAHLALTFLRAADLVRELGDAARATKLMDEALAHPRLADDALARAALASTRIRLAEETGDTELAAKLAAERLDGEDEPGVRAALALRIAEHAASIGDGAAAQDALKRANESDPTSVPARALAVDLAATAGEPTGFASQLESLAEQFPTPGAAVRALLFAAVVWATEARDENRARAALARAKERGAAERTVAELARSLAYVVDSPAWYDEASRALLALADEDEGEKLERRLELVRGRLLASDVAGAATQLQELSATAESGSGAAWIASLLLAFLPAQPNELAPIERAKALDRLAGLESRAPIRLGLGLLAARLVQRSGDAKDARRRLLDMREQAPDSVLIGVMLARLEQSMGLDREAAATLADVASRVTNEELGGSLELESGFVAWRAGAKKEALEAFQRAAALVPKVGALARTWATRGHAAKGADARMSALDDAAATGENGAHVGLERWATSLAGRDAARAVDALTAIEDDAAGDLSIAAALARLSTPGGAADAARFDRAASTLAKLGGRPESLAEAERFAAAREGDPERAAHAAARWFAADGGMTAGLEWLSASMAAGSVELEAQARRAIGTALGGDTGEALHASAAIAEFLAGVRRPDAAPVAGSSDVVRLANLELAPPGADPRRRQLALRELGPVLGDDTRIDALGLGAWSLLVSGDAAGAARLFEQVAKHRPTDLAAWEGLRTAAELLGDLERRAIAASELGKRCREPLRAAAFFEEAGIAHAERNDAIAAETSFAAAFERDPRRAVAFDKLFRRVRDRRDGEKMLSVIKRRLDVSDEPTEIAKLFWEQARVLREKGDIDGALKALENVTMIEPEHVGALALTGEIFIKRGEFDQAATTLATLAGLKEAPAKSRLTAGIAAVDLYENKLDRFDRALDVLIGLHKAGLSTLPVRERLARAAARAGAWNEAIAILEQLMQERAETSGRVEAARLAMAIHRDRLKAPQAAIGPVLKLLEEAPSDGEAIDMLLGLALPDAEKRAYLTKARGVLLTALRLNPIDLPNAERLVRVAHALGDADIESVALTVAAALGSASSAATLHALAAKRRRAPEVALTDDRFAALLAPGDEGPLATLFAFLAPTLAEALGPSLSALGITKRDRVDPKAGLPLRNEIAAWAGAFGIPAFELYVGGRDPTAVQGVPGEVPALVVGPEVNAPLDPPARARIARELLGLVRGTTVLRLRDDTSVAAIVVASCRLADVPIESPAYAMLGEIEKAVSKAMPRKVKKTLHDTCREIAATRPDAMDYRRRALASQARAAVVASGDVAFVLSEMLEGALERVHGSVRADERATELLRFVLSPTFIELRRSLGLDR